MGHIRPRMRNRRCSNCGHEFAVWIGHTTFKHSTAHRIVFLYIVVVAIAAILLCVDLYRLSTYPTSSWMHRGADAIRSLGHSSTVASPATNAASSSSEAPTDLSRF